MSTTTTDSVGSVSGGTVIDTNSTAAYLEDDLGSLLELLPARLATAVADAQARFGALEDIRIDVGVKPEVQVGEKSYQVNVDPVTREEIDAIDAAVRTHGGRYNDELRAAIDGSIHRISPVKLGDTIIGFSMRSARIASVDDYPLGSFVMGDGKEARKSILIIGPPGSGKSTKLRALVRELSEEYGLGMSVVVCDPSGELGGSGETPHPGLGRARRLPFVNGRNQAFLMKQAVRNHGARVLAVDEIAADKQEAFEAVWASRSGVTLLATVHARSLQDLVENKKLEELLGGVEKAAVKDSNMSQNGGSKFTSESGEPAFDIAVELHADHYTVHTNVKESVKALLVHRAIPKGLTFDVPRHRMEVHMAADAAPQRPTVITGGLAAEGVA